jgi:hypothetical protein
MNRAIGFIVAGMAAGFVSGILNPLVFGVRSAIFGGMLAVGMLACAIYRENKEHLPAVVTLAVAVVASLVATIFIEGWLAVLRLVGYESMPSKVELEFVYTFSSCVLIAWGMFLCFRSYTLGQNLFLRILLFFGIPALSVLPRAIALEEEWGSGDLPLDVLEISAYCFVLGLLPFLLLWGIVARAFGFFRAESYERDVNRVGDVEDEGENV